MKGLPPLGAFRRSLSVKINDVRASRFLRDRISVSLLVGALFTSGFSLVLLTLHLPAIKTDLPLSYSSLTGFDGLGPWYSPFLITLFGLTVTVVNGVLAYQAFTRSRLASFFLLAGAVVVTLFCLIIANAFTGVGQ